ncbi:hypothetical protein [Xanthobacter oligotrophicus]|uniref:hypothetical protein n=1 Tax=Xanthobacter oligotrophicus TaxID=2607286 RepID=UPI0011F208FB|nr:hypothetical protein [Xanthobacter oligotrophicus]MCG5235353.1 hypothetical protein [Xanthobacter oligotrophicus]
MGERTVMQRALFYAFSLERHVPAGCLVRALHRLVDLAGIPAFLARFPKVQLQIIAADRPET